MANTKTVLHFGPEWLRALSDGGGTNHQNEASTPLTHSSQSATTTSSSMSLSTGTHHNVVPSNRYKLAEFRYGREEMLALFDESIQMSPALVEFTGLYTEHCQIPLAMTSMTEEEQRLWSRPLNSEAVLRLNKTGNPMERVVVGIGSSGGGAPGMGIGPGGPSGMGVEREGRERLLSDRSGSGVGSGPVGNPSMRMRNNTVSDRGGRGGGRQRSYYSRTGVPYGPGSGSGGQSLDDDLDPNGSGGIDGNNGGRDPREYRKAQYDRTMSMTEDGVREKSFDRSYVRSDSTEDPNRLRKDGRSMDNWRARADERINWRARGRNDDNWNRNNDSWREGDKDFGPEDGSAVHRRRTYAGHYVKNKLSGEWGEDDRAPGEDDDRRRDLPEWSYDYGPYTEAKVGSFDASGAFREDGPDEDDGFRHDSGRVRGETFENGVDGVKTRNKVNDTVHNEHNAKESFNETHQHQRSGGVKMSTVGTGKSVKEQTSPMRQTTENNLNRVSQHSPSRESPHKMANDLELHMREQQMINNVKTMSTIEYQSGTAQYQQKMMNEREFLAREQQQTMSGNVKSNFQTHTAAAHYQQTIMNEGTNNDPSIHSTTVNTSSVSTSSFEDDGFSHLEKAAESMVAQWTAEEEQKERPSTMINQEMSKMVVVPKHHENGLKWFYRDPQGDIQGPFTSHEMCDWFQSCYFSMDLLVRRGCDERFSQLGELIKLWDRVPFIQTKDIPPPIRNEPSPAPSMATASAAVAEMMGTPRPTMAAGLGSNASGVTGVSSVGPVGLENAMSGTPNPMAGNLNIADYRQMLLQQHEQLSRQYYLNQELQMQNQLRQLLEQLKKQEGFAALSQQEQQNVLIQLYVNNQQQLEQSRQQVVAQQPVPPVIPGSVPQPQQVRQNIPDEPKSMIEQLARLGVPVMPNRTLTSHGMTNLWDVSGAAVLTASALEEMQRQEAEKLEMEEKSKLEKQLRAKEEAQRYAEEQRIQMELQKSKEERLRIELERKIREELLEKEEKERQERLEQEKFEKERREMERIEQEKRQQAEKEQRRTEEKQRKLEKQKREEKEKEEQERLRCEAIAAAEVEKQLQEQQRSFKVASDEKKGWLSVGQQTRQQPVSLVEIQKLQEQKENEERMNQYNMERKMLEAKQQAQRGFSGQGQQGGNTGSKNLLRWVNNNQQMNQRPVKTLAEIQMEEAAKLSKQKQEEERKVVPIVNTGSMSAVWNNAAARLSWKTNDSGSSSSTSRTNSAWTSGGGVSSSSSSQSSNLNNANSGSSSGFFAAAAAAAATSGFSSNENAWNSENRKSAASNKLNNTDSAFQQSNKSNSSSKSNQNTRARKDEEVVKMIFEKQRNQKSDEFTEWCIEILSKFKSSIDVPTFVGFLKDVESPYDLNDYIKSYLGESKETKEFAKQFLEKRLHYRNKAKEKASEELMWGPAPAINPSTRQSSHNPSANSSAGGDSSSTSKSGKKKKKGKKQETIPFHSIETIDK